MAAAISLFGFELGAALATVVGVLIEVPVMLSVVYLVKRSKGVSGECTTVEAWLRTHPRWDKMKAFLQSILYRGCFALFRSITSLHGFFHYCICGSDGQ